MIGLIYVYVDTVFGCGFLFVCFAWIFQHTCLDTYCFERLIIKLYACFVLLYLPLFSAVEHVSHGKAL